MSVSPGQAHHTWTWLCWLCSQCCTCTPKTCRSPRQDRWTGQCRCTRRRSVLLLADTTPNTPVTHVHVHMDTVITELNNIRGQVADSLLINRILEYLTTVKLCYSESGRPRHIFSLLPSSRYSQMTNLPRETKGNNLGTGAVDVFIINR